VKCLDHRGIVIQHAVKQGRARLRNALKCISEAMSTVMASRTSDLEETCLASVAKCQDKADNPSASHGRKHKACISEIEAYSLWAVGSY